MPHVKEAEVKARNNPTDEQRMRRLRRPPVDNHDPKIKNDAYWALRSQGHSHSHAKRVFRDQKPGFVEREVTQDAGDCDPDDLLFPVGSTWKEPVIAIRPLLSNEAIAELEPRDIEYTVWDQALTSFGVRVRPSGHKTYVVYYRIANEKKLQKRTIAKVGELTLEQARDAAKRFRLAARKDYDPHF